MHANATLTPRHRLKVAQLVVDDGWPISEVAARFQASWPTVKRWADRYRAGEPMHDRSSRPHHRSNKTHPKVVKRCISLRMRPREGPVQLAPRRGIASSTVHRILSSCHLNRLTHVGRRQGEKSRAATPDKPRKKHDDPLMGNAYVHTVIDDHSRDAYAEIHDDETAITATTVLVRAVEWFNARGVTVERILSDKGGAHRSHLWRDTCAVLGIKHKRIRPYRPQTNGKIERFHRTLADGWAYARCYTSEAERRGELDGWLHHYNQHRPHTACGNQPPFSRLTNVSGQYT